MCFELLKKLTSATNRTFSIQHACGLLTTPTLLVCADATVHAQMLCWKGSSKLIIKQFCSRVLQWSGYIEHVWYVLYRALVAYVMHNHRVNTGYLTLIPCIPHHYKKERDVSEY